MRKYTHHCPLHTVHSLNQTTNFNSLDENLNFLIQDKCRTAGVSCTFPKTHHTSCSQDRAKFHVHFPTHILKFLRTGVGKVQESVQEILLYPELQEIQLFFQYQMTEVKA